MRKSELASKLKFLIHIGIKYYSMYSLKKLQKKYDKCRYEIGYFGLFKRYCIVKNLAHSCGDNVAIYDNVIMNNIEKMDIGCGVAFNSGAYIEAYGGIRIGNNVGISQGVSIFTTNHVFDRTDIPHSEQGLEKAEVVIGNDVWLGSKSTVLMGVTIGNGCVVGSGAVVSKSLPEYSVSVGVPAKVIRMRK